MPITRFDVSLLWRSDTGEFFDEVLISGAPLSPEIKNCKHALKVSISVELCYVSSSESVKNSALEIDSFSNSF